MGRIITLLSPLSMMMSHSMSHVTTVTCIVSFAWPVVSHHHHQMSAFVSHAQRSFSADDLSPSTSDHEKWEREALTDYLLSARGRSLVDKTS